jgi:hypothetical protein
MVRKRLEVPERLNVRGDGFSGYKVRDYDYSKKVSPKSANEGGCAFTVLMICATATGVFLWV